MDLEERVARLEERFKLNFLEIEKRLAGLPEEADSKKLEEHIKEIEDLLLYVEVENTKIKEMIAESDPVLKQIGFSHSLKQPDNISKKLSSIEKRINSFEAELHKKEFYRAVEKELAENIQKRKQLEKMISELEKRTAAIKTPGYSHLTDGKIQSLTQSFQTLRSRVDDLYKTVATIEHRMNTIHESIRKEIAAHRKAYEEKTISYVSRHLEKFAKTVNKKLPPEKHHVHNKLSELEKKISELSNKISRKATVPVVVE
jgi:DNA anti-recombination protein RmuC